MIKILWSFDLISQQEMNVVLMIFVGFQQRDSQNTQSPINDTFCRLRVTTAQCIVEIEKKP